MVAGDGSPSAGSTGVAWKQLQEHASIFALDSVVICMVTTRPPKTIVKPTALGPVANTDTKLLIYGLFQKGRVLAQDAVGPPKFILLSRLNIQPARLPVNASPLLSRTTTHDSGPIWFATPSLGGTCTRETYRFVPAHRLVKILERPTGQQFEPSGLQMPVGAHHTSARQARMTLAPSCRESDLGAPGEYFAPWWRRASRSLLGKRCPMMRAP